VAKSILLPCLHCKELFRPHPGNRWHQKYCLKADCRKASKAESQRRWLEKGTNRDYFRGSDNVERVRQWRSKNPQYWKRARKTSGTLQDHVSTQVVENEAPAKTTSEAPLQDLVSKQDPLLLGLITQLIDSPLQDHVEQTTLQLLSKGLSFLDMRSRGKSKGTTHESQKAGPVSGATTPGAGPIQLDRSTVSPPTQLSGAM
jgi:hypothetical protein